MGRTIDETGNIYGYLTVIKRAKNDNRNRAQWLCKCKCGNEITVQGVYLRNGHTKSCGCYQKEQTSKACKKQWAGKTIGNFTVLEEPLQGTKLERSKIHCRCNLCGNENVYLQSNTIYKQYSCGCDMKSKGERKITELLSQANISFITEKRFADCVFEDTKRPARFDFYINNQYLLEYDGRQHLKQGNGVFDNEEKFNRTQEHDQYKNEWCKNHNIPLIRIPYTHYNDICLDDLLLETTTYLVE